ncbi:MAG: hypothetical protein V5A62_07045 [Haloarculaceae archaeon]
MRPAPTLVVLLLAVLAGCGALGGADGGGGTGSTPTLTPAAVPTAEPTPASAAAPRTANPAPVLLENARGREYVIVLSVIEGPVSTVEVVYDDGRATLVDYATDPSALDERLAEGSVVGVWVPESGGTERYRVPGNTSLTRRPFPALGRAGAGTSVVWVAVPAGEGGVPATVDAAGVETCAPPHSLVTEFRVRVRVDTDRVRVDCA